MLHLGAVTYNVLKEWDVQTIIVKPAAAGFEAVELRTGHRHGVEPTLAPGERVHIRKRFEAGKTRLLSFGTTIQNIGASLRELGEYGRKRGIEIWMPANPRYPWKAPQRFLLWHGTPWTECLKPCAG